LTDWMTNMPNEPTALTKPASSRLLSIDALRGFDMFWIVGGEEIFKTWAQWADWSHKDLVDEQLEHVPWEGFHFYDLIFPLSSS
jgi:predicted acyltransferase